MATPPVGTGPVTTGPVATGPVATGPVATGPVATEPVSTRCSAYDCLNEQLEQSYKSYRKLRQEGELDRCVKNHVPKPGDTKPDDMYVPHHCYTNEEKPADHTSDYLRGGVISTMATFEAFAGDLINEAAKLVKDKYKSNSHELKSINSRMSKKCIDSKPQELTPWNVLYHSWAVATCKSTCSCADCIKTKNGVYSKYLLTDLEIQQGKTIVDVMLAQGDLKFNHTIRCGTDPSKTSSIKVSKSVGDLKQSKCFICIMLRFCYGIRCVMAHGNSEKTCEKDGGALYKFPECCKTCDCDKDKCDKDKCPTCKCFKDTARLVELYNKIYKFLDELIVTDKINDDKRRVRRIPKKKDFQDLKKEYKKSLTSTEWIECVDIIDDHFPDSEVVPLPASYAYFHMLRVYHWLKNSKRAMYITYGMFERITTFIRTLAFRMYLAVAQLLIDNYKLPDGVWGVKKGNIETLITDFEDAVPY